MAAPGQAESPRQGNRRGEVMRAAAALIAAKGYEATSMRDIAAAVGMLPGSLYYHFPSKEELFLAVHAEAVARLRDAVEQAAASRRDPWDRLEAALVAHLEMLLGTSNLVAIVAPDAPAELGEAGRRLVEQRDAYERVFRDLVAALALPDGIDRGVFRLLLLGAVNWAPKWFRDGDGRLTPAAIARQLVAMLRDPMRTAADNARPDKRSRS